VLAGLPWSVPEHPALGRSPASALGALARAWVARFDGPSARLGMDLFGEALADERVRVPFTELLNLDALLLGLALERLRPPEPGARLVRVAKAALTTLHGASRLTAAAPGFVEPFDVVSACARLGALSLNDYWAPPPSAPPARPADSPWAGVSTVDLVTGEEVALGDGVVVVLGLHRLSAAEEAVRAGADTGADAGAGAEVTVAVVTGEPAELDALARLVITELAGCLRQSFPRSAWPRLRVVCDPAVAPAAGLTAVSDATEAAILVTNGRIVSRADGTHAAHTIATAATKAWRRA